MQSYYSLSLLCLTFCAVAKCEITTGLDCRAEKHVGETEKSLTEKSTNGYYCPDGTPANYDGQSGRHHCCTMSLRQGKCPGKCRKLRSKRSVWGQMRNLIQPSREESFEESPEYPMPDPKPNGDWPWEWPAEESRTMLLSYTI